MRIQTVLWIGGTAALCLACFILGRLSGSRGVGTYYVNGYATSFNHAWPTYGLFLAEDRALLRLLRAGNPTNAIPKLEAMLDMAVYDAMHRRPLLRRGEVETLDKVLTSVALYRKEFPRAIDAGTNGLVSQQLQRQEAWVTEKRDVDRFLRGFVHE